MWKFLGLKSECGDSVCWPNNKIRLMWKFLDLERERGGFVCWPNNKIIDSFIRPFARDEMVQNAPPHSWSIAW